LFFVKRKAVEYCESDSKLKYTTALRPGITEQLKNKSESLK